MMIVHTAVVFLTCFELIRASSIYVKNNYEAGMRVVEPEEGSISTGVCEDTNKHTCEKIQQWYGERTCSDKDPYWFDTMRQICPKTCGFCDCKDRFESLCMEYSHLCNKDGELGSFMKEICAKSCNMCNAKGTKQDGELVVINDW